MDKIVMLDSKEKTIVRSKNYNYNFNKKTGEFARWGKTTANEDDPKVSPIGPEILDIEIGTICNGIGKPCSFCYKSNTPDGTYMNFETFKKIIDKMKSVKQIAFGLGDIDSNPDLWEIMKYCREKGIIPNITINGAKLNDEIVSNLAKYCGAVAVSHYNDDVCFNAIKMLTDKGCTQINIHQLLSEDTYKDCLKLIEVSKIDERLKKMNAIVFLHLKPKGDRNKYKVLKDREKIQILIKYALGKNVSIGFDSCFAPLFLESVKDHKDFNRFELFSESCESSRFSQYIDVNGKAFPCSFCEGEKEYKGIDVINCKDFIKDVWNDNEVKSFRNRLLNTENNGCFKCPQFDIY